MTVQDISIEAYDYLLPDERIAKFPLLRRDESKLLHWNRGAISQYTFRQLSDLIPSGSLLVFNNTKVIQARMLFTKETGAQVEIFCLEPKEPADYAQSFARTHRCDWLCLVGNSKRWKGGKLSKAIAGGTCTVERLESYGESHLVRFEWDNPALTFSELLEQYGELPIPPYLNRKTEESDKETYQTVYSKIEGSVAAPTAGLHFTPAVFESLGKNGVELQELTLHVGAGTFKPVKTEAIGDHTMHTEAISIDREAIANLIRKQGQVFAVGTTSVRTLESLYYIGAILEQDPNTSPETLAVEQWMPYDNELPHIEPVKALGNILDYMDRLSIDRLTTHTRILIAPGYRFHIVNGIITNFHQPKSTLLLLISAFVGEDWKTIYDYALANDFRFLSYGDSSLLM